MSVIHEPHPVAVRAASDLYVPAMATVLDTAVLTASERLITLAFADGSPLGQTPGQFVQVSILGMEEAPISVCSAAGDGGSFQLCVRRMGKLTRALHELRSGQSVGIRGPFGHGFDVDAMEGKDLVFVAGGIGLAPMRSLIRHCLGRRGSYGRLTLLYGAKRPSERLFVDELEQWGHVDGFGVRTIVDVSQNGWTGPVGLITTLVSGLALEPARTVAAIVGPPVMYPHVVAGLKAKGLADEQMVVSLERHMRCGVGKCGHCMIEDVYYCCCDGPVFRLSQLSGVRGAI